MRAEGRVLGVDPDAALRAALPAPVGHDRNRRTGGRGVRRVLRTRNDRLPAPPAVPPRRRAGRGVRHPRGQACRARRARSRASTHRAADSRRTRPASRESEELGAALAAPRDPVRGAEREAGRARSAASSPAPAAWAPSPSRRTWPGRGTDIVLGGGDAAEHGSGGGARRPVRDRHEPPREPAHRRSAARPRRAPGRSRHVTLLHQPPG